MITPEQLAFNGTEDAHQKALLCWCSLNLSKYPELKWLHHSPNGGSRHKAEAAKFRAMGVKNGFPDLVLLVKRGRWPGLLIELKRPGDKDKKAGRPSKEQEEWISFLRSQGYGAMVCYGWEHARDTLISYLEYK